MMRNGDDDDDNDAESSGTLEHDGIYPILLGIQ